MSIDAQKFDQMCKQQEQMFKMVSSFDGKMDSIASEVKAANERIGQVEAGVK